MSDAISPQHPAVVLRSHYTLVRALLAVAVIAVVALAAAVVILAVDGDDAGGTSAVRQSAPAAPQAVQGSASGIRYDSGPEEGTRGIQPEPTGVSAYNGPH